MNIKNFVVSLPVMASCYFNTAFADVANSTKDIVHVLAGNHLHVITRQELNVLGPQDFLCKEVPIVETRELKSSLSIGESPGETDTKTYRRIIKKISVYHKEVKDIQSNAFGLGNGGILLASSQIHEIIKSPECDDIGSTSSTNQELVL